MEEFKKFDDILVIDKLHTNLASISGRIIDLEKWHKVLDGIQLIDSAPDPIKGQFNVLRNMAIYTYFHYALAPEVCLKAYTLIEYGLRIKVNSNNIKMLHALLKVAIENEWITDKGFRHLNNPQDGNQYCQSLSKVLPSLRNKQAHGSTMLDPWCLTSITICADLINQIFSEKHKP